MTIPPEFQEAKEWGEGKMWRQLEAACLNALDERNACICLLSFEDEWHSGSELVKRSKRYRILMKMAYKHAASLVGDPDKLLNYVMTELAKELGEVLELPW